MAASSENIAKTCENPKENGVKLKENCKESPSTNGKCNIDAVVNGSSSEIAKPTSQKSSPTQTQKSLHSSSSSSKAKTDSKGSSETPAKDRKRHDGHGKKTKAFADTECRCHSQGLTGVAKIM